MEQKKHDSKFFAHKKRDFAYDFSFRAFSRFSYFCFYYCKSYISIDAVYRRSLSTYFILYRSALAYLFNVARFQKSSEYLNIFDVLSVMISSYNA